MSHLFGRPRGPVILYLPLVLLAVAGCIPEELWLDDSSGFVYSVGKDETTQEIRFYEMVRRAERVVWSGSSEAGFHLDSAEQVLYVIEPRRSAGGPPSSYRLSVHDIKSNRLVRSTRWMTWHGNDLDVGILFLTKLPNRRSHFLVNDMGRHHRTRNAILNADAESLIDVSGVDLEIIPDGSGFLARTTSVMQAWEESLKSKKKLDAHAIEDICRQSIWIVDLKGVRHRMTWEEPALRRAAALYGEQLRKAKASAKPENETYTGLLSDERSKWQGNGAGNQRGPHAMTLLLGHEQGATRIDIKRQSITDVVGLTVAVNDKGPALSPALDSGPSVLLVKLKDVEYRANILEKPATYKDHYVASLEVRWPAEGKSKTLLNRVNIKDISKFSRTSPNRLYAVLKYEEPSKDEKEVATRVHCLIVDNAGNIFDRLFFHHLDRSWNVAVEAQSGLPETSR
jgi:hypothetical protein